MIDEEATFKEFGYYSSDLKPQSHKKIIAVCDDCGKVRINSKDSYRTRCYVCVRKGENNANWKGGLVMRVCEECGIEFPVYPSAIKYKGGKFCSPKCMGIAKRGEKSSFWKGGISFEPYCEKFNDEFKEYIRDKFGRTCFLCGKTEEDNGRKLSVHHCNGNKACGCDGDETCQFVPLCMRCHAKVHSKKVNWEKKIKDMMKNKLNGWYI